MIARTFAVVLLLVMGGCISRQELADAIPKDDAYCQSIGARPGSDAYAQCRLQLRKELLDKQADRRRALNAMGDGLAAAGAQMQADELARQAKSFKCTSTRYGDTINTACQ